MAALLLLPLLAALCSGLVTNEDGRPIVGAPACSCPSQTQYYVGGTITSPGWKGSTGNSAYCGPLVCTYTLNAQQGEHVRLTFIAFSTEPKWDNLTLYDGDKGDDDEAILALISGPSTPTTSLISGQQFMTLTFRTDSGGNSGGWRIQWQSTTTNGCGNEQLSGAQASVQTPNYPYNYPTNLICVWNYTAPSGTLAQITFSKDADTEKGYDIVTVRGGGQAKSFSGPADAVNFQPVVSSTGFLSMEFHSDESVMYNGFAASFAAFTPPPSCDCGNQVVTLSDATGSLNLASPNFGPGSTGYCRNANCQWIIQVPDTFKAHIHFMSFELETGYDTLDIKNDINGGEIEKCTGTHCTDATSVSNFLTLNFHTDSSVSKEGFFAVITAVTH